MMTIAPITVGGTSRGITQREYDAWTAENDLPSGDVWKAPQEQVDTIYHEEYWLPYGDLFPSGIDYLFFDMAVNAGPHQATLLLQRSVGTVAHGSDLSLAKPWPTPIHNL